MVQNGLEVYADAMAKVIYDAITKQEKSGGQKATVTLEGKTIRKMMPDSEYIYGEPMGDSFGHLQFDKTGILDLYRASVTPQTFRNLFKSGSSSFLPIDELTEQPFLKKGISVSSTVGNYSVTPKTIYEIGIIDTDGAISVETSGLNLRDWEGIKSVSGLFGEHLDMATFRMIMDTALSSLSYSPIIGNENDINKLTSLKSGSEGKNKDYSSFMEEYGARYSTNGGGIYIPLTILDSQIPCDLIVVETQADGTPLVKEVIVNAYALDAYEGITIDPKAISESLEGLAVTKLAVKGVFDNSQEKTTNTPYFIKAMNESILKESSLVKYGDGDKRQAKIHSYDGEQTYKIAASIDDVDLYYSSEGNNAQGHMSIVMFTEPRQPKLTVIKVKGRLENSNKIV